MSVKASPKHQNILLVGMNFDLLSIYALAETVWSLAKFLSSTVSSLRRVLHHIRPVFPVAFRWVREASQFPIVKVASLALLFVRSSIW